MKLHETHTWQEIMSQPRIWNGWAGDLAQQAAVTRSWIKQRKIDTIWLSGAGTSDFIGGVIASTKSDLRFENRASTDIVSCPQDILDAKGEILSLQFGRSGDSSESVGVMDLLDAHRPDINRLHITCNPTGALSVRSMKGPGEQRVIDLPPETHDQGFAMTTSFTTMLLTALACLTDFDSKDLKPLAQEAERVLDKLSNSTSPRPERAVFLGSGALKTVARESALKVLELTAGQTNTQWDSPLGYRHGPKAAVNDATHVYIMIHPDPHTQRYDRDVAEEIKRQFPQINVTTIGRGCDIEINGTGNAAADAVLYVLPAQVRAAQWSHELGLHVDDPFQGQNLSRVVTDVKLYDWEK